MKTKTINFVTQLFAKRDIPYIYSNIYNKVSGEYIYENNIEIEPLEDVFIVEDLPRYLKIEEVEKPKNFHSYKFKQYPGFRIDFKDVKSLSGYLNERFGKSSRYKLRREQRKLEHCFDISYKMYYGEMPKDEYDFVFDEFYKLLEVRSIEKGITGNANLKYKDDYYRRVHNMILNKDASFFVIYNGKNPIDICLNFHVKNTIFQYIRTYDIAYSKFNTGYTDLMKQIEWCIANNVDSISFSKGSYYWKQRWCNTVYDYDYEVFYNTKSIKAIFYATKFKMIKNLKQITRELGVIEKYHTWKEEKRKASLPEPTYKTEILESQELDFSTIEFIDFTKEEFSDLRRLTYEFLYASDEKEKDIKVYKDKVNKDTFFVLGSSNQAKITL